MLEILYVVDAQPGDGYIVHITFSNGEEHQVDLSAYAEKDGVFAALRDPAFFKQLYVDTEIETVMWPNGADICPNTLYELALHQQTP